MTAPQLPRVPSPPLATAKTVAGAIAMAATLNGGRKSAGYQQRFVELGVKIANGEFLWDDSAVLKAFDL